jgi:hypothetical protein
MIKKYYLGVVPVNCQLCNGPMGSKMFDAATSIGWACMCQTCHTKHGRGLGVGKGQQYEKQTDSRWLKTAG